MHSLRPQIESSTATFPFGFAKCSSSPLQVGLALGDLKSVKDLYDFKTLCSVPNWFTHYISDPVEEETSL